MAKLSFKITNNNENEETPKNIQNSNLSTKVNDTTNQTNGNNEQNNNKQEIVKNIEIPSNKTDFLKFVYENFGYESFGKINKEFIDKLVPAENQLSEEEITKKIISQILSDDIIKKITETINIQQEEYKILESELNQIKDKQSKQEQQLKNITIQLQDTEEQIFKTEKKYSDTIAISDIIKEFVSKSIPETHTKSISELLMEGYKNGEEQGKKFVLNFLKGCVWLTTTIKELGEDEKENLDKLYEATRQLLKQIKGNIASERRPLLEKVAVVCNFYLKEYDFISPEQSLQIDPLIHNAEGIGGTMVKEGLTFAVVRRETRKTVYYADILTK